LVENRTKYANKLHGLLSDHGITDDVKPLSVEGRKFLRELSLPTPWDALLKSYLEVIETITVENYAWTGVCDCIEYPAKPPVVEVIPVLNDSNPYHRVGCSDLPLRSHDRVRSIWNRLTTDPITGGIRDP